MENIQVSRTAQVVGVIVGLIGLYPAGLGIINLYSALTTSILWSVLVLPMIAIAIAFEIIAYRAIFQQTKKTFESLSAIVTFLIIIFADDYLEEIISKTDSIVDPQVAASGLAIVLAVVAYYGLKKLMNYEANKVKPNNSL